MINSLWISKTGMEAQQTQLDVISNNLANVSTNGFKRGNAVFEDLMYQNLRQVGANATDQSQLPTGLQLGLGVRTVATTRSFAQGTLQAAGPTDLAINGNGFFKIQQPDGTVAYTRDGSFHPDVNGHLVTSNGLPLIPTVTIPVTADPGSFTVGTDGVATYNVAGVPGAKVTITLANFVNPAGLEPRGQNLYTETAASGAPTDGTPTANGMGAVKQNYLEGSNVNVVQELVTMIQTQRAYELNSKAIQTSDQMLQKLGQL